MKMLFRLYSGSVNFHYGSIKALVRLYWGSIKDSLRLSIRQHTSAYVSKSVYVQLLEVVDTSKASNNMFFLTFFFYFYLQRTLLTFWAQTAWGARACTHIASYIYRHICSCVHTYLHTFFLLCIYTHRWLLCMCVYMHALTGVYVFVRVLSLI